MKYHSRRRAHVSGGPRRPAVKIGFFCVILAFFLFFAVVWREPLGQDLSYLLFGNETTCKNYIGNTLAFSGAMENRSFVDKLDELMQTCLGISIKSPLSMIDTQIAFAAQVEKPELPENLDSEQENSPPNNQPVQSTPPAPSKNETVKTGGKLLTNHTEYEIDESALLNKALAFPKIDSGYQVLVLHTHATESYLPDDRNTDDKKNVIRVGDELTKKLQEQGIKTLHIKTHHDEPSYNGSYQKSLETAEKILKEHPEIQIVIDLHRDAIQASDGGKLSLVAQVDGKQAAQCMLVVGTNAGGLEHSGWKDNLSFALQLQTQLNSNYPDLMRTVDVRNERFNQHLLDKYIIAEVGANGNELSDALVSADLLADGITKLIQANTK